MMNQFIMAKGDDGGGNVDVESPSVRGPPSLRLGAQIKDVAQLLMALCGDISPHIWYRLPLAD